MQPPTPSPSPLIFVSVAPQTVNVVRAASQPFSAVVTGTTNTAVTWSVREGASGGTVTAAGLYTAPVADGVFHVVTTSVEDPTKTATATVTVARGTFAIAGTLTTGHEAGMTATLLRNGTILVAGGFYGLTYGDCELTSDVAEIFNPNTGAVATTATMTTKRSGHTATLLPSGKVLITGGGIDCVGNVATAELYDPASNSFSATGAMSYPRSGHTATLLPNGTVLIAGGSDEESITTAEIYDPVTGTFSKTANMRAYRNGHSATLLPNGKVLFVAGDSGAAGVSSSEVYDPTTGTFKDSGPLSGVRNDHAATLLLDGRVAIFGGSASEYQQLATAEAYDSTVGLFRVAGSMMVGRSGAVAVQLADGTVLIAGGTVSTGATSYAPSSTAEIYDPATGTSVATGDMSAPHSDAAYVRLPDGRVLIFGGSITDFVEVYPK